MKLYIPVDGNPAVANFIKVETYYDLGGMNMFDYTQKKRGYYVRCTPVIREMKHGVQMESFTAYSGYKQLCKEVTRQSNKAAAEAEATAKVLYEAMVARICRENGLTIKEEAK